jgi:ribonuclease D
VDPGATTVEAVPATVEPLLAPRDGVPPVVESQAALAAAAARLAAGTGPIAVDAERASGYRYGQRAYLLQLRRRGTGTVLIDPTGPDDLAPMATALGDAEWVLHAASQDLPCLHELGLAPPSLFDTELAGRLLGYPRVGLAALVAQEFGIGLAKEHSAVDWSTRPLPEPWLVYAALDVEVLLELRDSMAAALRAAGKWEWAEQEFEAERLAPPPPARVDPWRRTSGVHRLRRARQLAVVRALWTARDEVARARDTAPGRILPDAAIVAAGQHPDAGPAELAALPEFTRRGARRHLRTWQQALAAAQELAEDQLPAVAARPTGPPPPRAWPDRDPAAAARLVAARAAVAAVADEVGMPAENVLPPGALKAICWHPPEDLDPAAVRRALAELGARPWQLELTAAAMAAALATDPATPARPSNGASVTDE